MHIIRFVEDEIRKAGKSYSCIALYGPRMCGKTVTVRKLFPDFNYVTLDDCFIRSRARDNPSLFLDNYGWPLIIDEIQKVPELMDEIKIRIDNQRFEWLKNNQERKLMYVLTGSNRYNLQKGISDSLAGRCGIIELLSLSAGEIYGKESYVFSADISKWLKYENENNISCRNKTQIFEDIFKGGMPDVVTGLSHREKYFESYVSTYIEKDVRELIAAGSEARFLNFLSIVALRTAQEVHYDTLANATGIDVRTCKNWISILQSSGIIYLLEPYMSSVSNRIIKAPKLYFTDTGLCSYLCRWQDALMLERCAMSGAFFETYVVSEILKNLNSNNINPKYCLYYYRDIDQKEVDLIYVENDEIYPIEIKKNEKPSEANKNFKVLKKYDKTIKPGLIIDNCDRIRAINENAYYLPVSLI